MSIQTSGSRYMWSDLSSMVNWLCLPFADHPYYVAVQYHPEYLSRPLKPSAPYLGLILASTKMLEKYISRDCKLSPRQEFYTESSDEELKSSPTPTQASKRGSGDSNVSPVKKSKTDAVAIASPSAQPISTNGVVRPIATNGSLFQPVMTNGNGNVQE